MSDEKTHIFDAALALDEHLPTRSLIYASDKRNNSPIPDDATDLPDTRDMAARRSKRPTEWKMSRSKL